MPGADHAAITDNFHVHLIAVASLPFPDSKRIWPNRNFDLTSFRPLFFFLRQQLANALANESATTLKAVGSSNASRTARAQPKKGTRKKRNGR